MSVLDYDPVVICPYDGNHKIARSRIQRHLVKCEKNFPPNYKAQCPYDATHRYFECDLKDHMENCPMKYSCRPELGQSTLESSDMSLPETVEPPEDHVWEEDLPVVSNADNLDDELTLEYPSLQNSGRFIRVQKHLRPPYGHAESSMIEASDLDSCMDDALSVSSDGGIGRGRRIPKAHSGQYQREMGIRGRLRR